MDVEFFERLAKALTAEFGSNCEVAVHDLCAEDAEHTVCVLENGHVSQRHIGDGPSKIVLEAFKHRGQDMPEDQLGYLMQTRDGRILKASTVYLKGQDGTVNGVLCINYDMTGLYMAEQSISSLIAHQESPVASDRIPQNVNDLLDDLIEQSVAITGKPVAMMNKEDKIKAINFLNNAGAFLVTKSGDKVSKYFGISKYTLYSYIDASRNLNKDENETIE